MKARPRVRLAAIALAALVGGCKSDSSVGPSQPRSLDQVFNEMSMSSLAPATSAASIGVTPVAMPSRLAIVPSSCSYDGTSKFTCSPLTVNGITITRSFTLLDAANKPQSQYDPATTAAVTSYTTTAGTFTADTRSVTINAQETMTVSGLLTGVHLLDGASTARISSPAAGAQPAFDNELTSTIHLVLPTATSKYPSGTVTMNAGAPGSSTTQPSVTMRMTFDGTSKVKVTTTIGALPPQSCTFDLGSQTPSCL